MSAFTASNSLLPTVITGWLVLSAFDPNLVSGLESLRSRSIVLSITLSKKLSAYFAGRGPLPLLARTSGFAEDRPSWPLLIPRIPQTTSALTPPPPPSPQKNKQPRPTGSRLGWPPPRGACFCGQDPLATPIGLVHRAPVCVSKMGMAPCQRSFSMPSPTCVGPHASRLLEMRLAAKIGTKNGPHSTIGRFF
jgi:hypothetical protein